MNAPRFSRLAGVSAYLPEKRISTTDLEEEIARQSPGFAVPAGSIESVTGVQHRYISPPDECPSDLAVAATQKLLAETGQSIQDADLIIFAATSLDVLEPATAHIVASKLGAQCPVFDVKNACNSFLNGLEVADALIRTGAYERILLCCGETWQKTRRLCVATPREFAHAMVSYTMSDAGAAMWIEAAAEPGILGARFFAQSKAWGATVIPIPSAPEWEWTNSLEAMMRAGRSLAIDRTVVEPAIGMSFDDVARFCMHLPTQRWTDRILESLDIPASRVSTTIQTHGNTAAATLPMQLALEVEAGRLHPGDPVVLLGMASGVSLGALALRL
ncbi:ketoacyl-ACP synthase III [Streptomyces sp. NBC_01216]|uniref:3-oxoacyl-ACP synthase III family protein n=1 Tax=Streptomyces sp. NBC_01216 TaxID=2903778 RepID=UPI002E14560B|nr:ketoacyl-ACP synthase III [Streptomyces sp. NBC_01216]